MTPYIITATRYIPHLPPQEHEILSRRAVATLEEARDNIAETIVNDHEGVPNSEWLRLASDAMHLPESGGTVGPLPDGTTILVERQPDDFDVDAFNREHGHG